MESFFNESNVPKNPKHIQQLFGNWSLVLYETANVDRTITLVYKQKTITC